MVRGKEKVVWSIIACLNGPARSICAAKHLDATPSDMCSKPTQQKKCLLGRGLVDDPLPLSNETRCRGDVSRSTTLSDTR
jgi:hypothetical protein